MPKNEIVITIYENRPKAFWADMGPFFARREVRREMPYLVDDDGYVWAVAREGRKVVGFGSLHISNEKCTLHGLYVVPEARNNGIAEALVKERLAYAHGKATTFQTTTNANSVTLYRKLGFKEQRTKGKYIVMAK